MKQAVKKLLFSFFFFFLVAQSAPAWGATRYALEAADGSGCSNGATNFNPATNACSGGSSTVYLGAGALTGIAATVAGDTFEFRCATVGGSCSYNFRLDANLTSLKSGTSWSNAPVIRGRAGDEVVILPGSGGDVFNIVNGGITVNLQYVIFENLIVDGTNVIDANAISVGFGGVHHIRFLNTTARRTGEGTGSSGNGLLAHHTGSFIEWIGGALHDNGRVFGGVPPSAFYGGYIESTDSLIERAKIYRNGGYGIHNYSGFGTEFASRNIYRFNEIHSNGAHFGQNSAGLLLGTGSGLEAHDNIIRGNFSYGLQIGNGASGAKAYNNTIQGNTYGVDFGSQTGTDFANNIVHGNTSIQINGSSGVTFRATLCGSSQTGCAIVADPRFADAPNNDFRLCSGIGAPHASCAGVSPAIDQGVSLGSPYDVDYSGTARPQGNAYDIGAFEFGGAAGSAPTIAITSPTANVSYAVTSSTLALSGSASDDVAVTTVTWSSTTCGSGTATGTTSWSINSIALSVGTCVITVTANDGAGNTGSDIITAVRVTPQLVLRMAMDEGSGSTVADTSGNSNNGTISNATWTTAGRFGTALVFDGTGDVVTVADSNSLDLVMFTMEAWVFPTAVSTVFRTVMVKSYVYFLYASVAGHCGDGAILAGYDVGGGSLSTGCYAQPLPINAWSHLAATYDSVNLKIYLNGVLVSTTAAGLNIAQSAGALTIGLSEFGEGFIGRIDEPRIYNYDVGAAQIALDMVTPITAIAVNPPIKLEISSAAIKCAALPACFKLNGQ